MFSWFRTQLDSYRARRAEEKANRQRAREVCATRARLTAEIVFAGGEKQRFEFNAKGDADNGFGWWFYPAEQGARANFRHWAKRVAQEGITIKDRHFLPHQIEKIHIVSIEDTTP